MIGLRGIGLSLLLLAAVTVHAAPQQLDQDLRLRLALAMADEGSAQDRFEAEVWLTDMSLRLSKRVPDPHERLQLLRQVYLEARRADLPPELVLAVIQVESNFDRFAISSAGAQGLMQIMPFWLDEIGRPDDNLFHVHTSLRMGCTILRYYLDMERGDLTRALARYNGSLGSAKYPQRIYTALRTRWYK
jgi:soluble lytic murein transglycosylase-like protein